MGGGMRPDMVMRSIIPVVMAGVLGIYGLITAVIINGHIDPANKYSAYSGYAHLGAGLTVGLSSLAAGLAIGIVGDAGVRANAQQPRLFVGMILILIFAEALGLYGLIVGLVVASTPQKKAQVSAAATNHEGHEGHEGMEKGAGLAKTTSHEGPIDGLNEDPLVVSIRLEHTREVHVPQSPNRQQPGTMICCFD